MTVYKPQLPTANTVLACNGKGAFSPWKKAWPAGSGASSNSIPNPCIGGAEDMLALPGLLESAVNRFFYINKKSTYTQAYAWIEQRTALFGP